MRYLIRGRRTGPVLMAAALATATVAACSNGAPDAGAGGTPTPSGPAASSPATSAAPSPKPTPTPTRTYPLSAAPRTIPAVQQHVPARGPGWSPGPAAGIVVAPGSEALTDEARLLAGELKVAFRGTAAAGPADIELALGGTGAPESYTLTATGGRVRITGPDEAGVFYGTRTVKQAVRSAGEVPEGVIRDRPAKPQRGLQVDIARKYFTPGWIEARLREMADLKLNQFELHFADDQGFRIASDSHPEIVSAEHLTKAQVRRIIALARSLHITVVPEVDSPGHLGAVLRAHPDLRLLNVQGTPRQGAIDISKPASARIVDDLLREYAALFPGGWFHVGADEYQALTVRDPAASYPQLASAAVARYGAGASVADLAEGWLNDRAAVVRGAGKTAKAWNDGFFRGGKVSADKRIEVEYWTGTEIGARPPAEYLAEGRKVVNLNDKYLYYVLGEPNQFTYPTGRAIYEEWTPRVLRGSTPVASGYDPQILGGRFAVWCDRAGAQTQSQVAEGIRLPVTATAQKLWDARRPTMSWATFRALATTLRGG